jgi:hypothetical protein
VECKGSRILLSSLRAFAPKCLRAFIRIFLLILFLRLIRIEQLSLIRVFIPSGVDDGLGFVHQLLDGLEPFVNAGEADEGHLIDIPQFFGNEFTDEFAGHFAVVGFENLVLDLIPDASQIRHGNRAFETSPFQASDDFFTVPRLTAAVSFDNGQANLPLNSFVGGEALAAAKALPPSSNRLAGVARPRVNHLQTLLIRVAERAAHWGNKIAIVGKKAMEKEGGNAE